MSDEFHTYDWLAEAANAYDITALTRLYANISHPYRPFMWDVEEEADNFFYDGHDPQNPPQYWVLNGEEEPVLGTLLPRKGLTEGEFRQRLPQVELLPTMRAVGVVQVIGYFQFIVYSGDLAALVEACGYGR